MKAKDTSHIGMVIGAISLSIVFIVTLIKFFMSDDFKITIEQAISFLILGVSPSVPFCPVYISTWLDKLHRLGNKE